LAPSTEPSNILELLCEIKTLTLGGDDSEAADQEQFQFREMREFSEI
jgi:hypothetical protein